MSEIVMRQTKTLTTLTDDLARSLSADELRLELPGRSNTIGSQFWCVVGGRESYLEALRAGKWQGFACSLNDAETHSPEVLVERLAATRADWDRLEPESLTEYQTGMVLRLNEHEAQHQGQLIRFAYSLGIAIPENWKAHWALTD